jgi:hypothetical protein
MRQFVYGKIIDEAIPSYEKERSSCADLFGLLWVVAVPGRVFRSTRPCQEAF